MDWKKEEGDAFPYYVYGASCSEVEVDCLTGAHKVNSNIRAGHLHSTNKHIDVFSLLCIAINLILPLEEPGTDLPS